MREPVIHNKTAKYNLGGSIQFIIKRGMDIVISSFLLITLLPVFLVIAIAIFMEDRGPVLFKQERTGRRGDPFQIYKFRSMKVKVDTNPSFIIKHKWESKVPDDFVFKNCSHWNPDVTKVGRFIRKYSLDELPQLWNVWLGEMSLIGPRPEVPEITKWYDTHQKRRLEARPGMTGWAQVNGRSEMTHGQKVEFDNYYINHFSLKMDLKIIALTCLQVTAGKGAV